MNSKWIDPETMYAVYDKPYGSFTHNRKCIDGSVTSCSNCVGYCTFSDHEGFLTAEMRREHNCLGKGCYYYRAKERGQGGKPIKQVPDTRPADFILQIAKDCSSDMEGLKIMHVRSIRTDVWQVGYITISHEYDVDALAAQIGTMTGALIEMRCLPLDFETCMQLILSA